MQLSYIDCPYSWFERWSQTCPVNQYRAAKSSELPDGLPASLLQKSPGVLIVSSGDTVNTCYLMANVHRLDRGSVIDQEPLIMAFDHQNQTACGAFLHHGEWPTRTYVVNTAGLSEIVHMSGIEAYYPCVDLPKTLEGPVSDLKVVSSANAESFWNAVTALDRDLRNLKQGAST